MGRSKTIPMRLLRFVRLTLGLKISVSSKKMLPVWLVPTIRSVSRLRLFRRVVFPLRAGPKMVNISFDLTFVRHKVPLGPMTDITIDQPLSHYVDDQDEQDQGRSGSVSHLHGDPFSREDIEMDRHRPNG